ncbi:MAG: T9SS type A sorting domain-containing protein [Bacteroidota bacterium]
MKKVSLIFLVLNCLGFTIAGQSIADSGNEWRIGYFDWMQGWITDHYKVEGDTLINGKTYGKIYLNFENLHLLIRQDSSKKVFFLAQGNTEYQIYDFGAAVGDTISSISDTSFLATVESIDSIMLLNGEMRKRQKIVPLDCNVHLTGAEYWIEGIGGELVFPFGDITQFCTADNNNPLNCFSSNGELLFGPQLGLECDLLLSTNELSSADFSMYPNPTDHNFIVKNKNGKDGFYQFDLIDFKGKVLLRESRFLTTNESVKMNTTQLSNGIYFLRIRNEEIIFNKKVIVQR